MDNRSSPQRAKVLIVEDEIFVADDLRATLEDLGFEPVGIAPDRATAFALADAQPDIALVDLNLRDGETGPEIGQQLAEKGVAVLFVTANPRSLGQGVPGALGAVSKPLDVETARQAMTWLCERRRNAPAEAPEAIRVFG